MRSPLARRSVDLETDYYKRIAVLRRNLGPTFDGILNLDASIAERVERFPGEIVRGTLSTRGLMSILNFGANIQLSFSETESRSETQTRSIATTIAIPVPPRSRVLATLKIDEINVDVPFSGELLILVDRAHAVGRLQHGASNCVTG